LGWHPASSQVLPLTPALFQFDECLKTSFLILVVPQCFLFFFQFDMLELDRFAKPLVNCPLLLDSAGYLPDTVDLTQDEEAREYWLQCFEDATGKVRVVVQP
jgi:hypothetical protein